MCFKCNVLKPLTEFYKHPRMADGHLGKCKACNKVDTRENKLDKREKYLDYDRQRAKLPHRLEAKKRIVREWRKKHPKRQNAHSILNREVRKGRIIPQPCFICGEKAEAHHPDYDRPLDVVWLCPTHHKQAHAIVHYLNEEEKIRKSRF